MCINSSNSNNNIYFAHKFNYFLKGFSFMDAVDTINNPLSVWQSHPHLFLCFLHSMSLRRGSLQMNPWNNHTSRVWACVCKHCKRVSAPYTNTHTHSSCTTALSHTAHLHVLILMMCCGSADISIFTLKEVQLQRDPGYRNSSYPETGVCLLSSVLCMHVQKLFILL